MNRRHAALAATAGVVGVAGWVAGRVSTLAQRRVLAAAAMRDPLTGLANRAGFARAARTPATADDRGVRLLLVVDLDGFKAVNDSHGHAAGDAVLVQAADRLRRCVDRAHHVQAAAARLGGDEFAVLVTVPTGPGGTADRRAEAVDHLAAGLAVAVWQAVGQPYTVTVTGRPPVTATVGASVGVQVIPSQQAVDLDQVLDAADAAMYSAKRRGGGWAVRPGQPDLPGPEGLPRSRAQCDRSVDAGRPPSTHLRPAGPRGSLSQVPGPEPSSRDTDWAAASWRAVTGRRAS